MPISFPTSPALNQTFTTNDGNFYRYNGKGWVRSSPNFSCIAVGSITGNLIANLTIESVELANGAVTTEKLNLANGYLQLPVGTTVQRPANPANGVIRFNLTNSWLEYSYDNAWYSLTGTNTGIYTVEYLMVAGGGAGAGAGGYEGMGGGGAGGVLSGNANVVAAISYTMTVGAGGSGFNVSPVTAGNPTCAFSLPCACGGGFSPSGTGGSGGGGVGVGTPQAGGPGIPGQGNPGGTGPWQGCGGGGGGAGGSGGSGGPGGSATSTYISWARDTSTGVSCCFAGGGGGGYGRAGFGGSGPAGPGGGGGAGPGGTTSTPGSNATVSTGSGGGGGGNGSPGSGGSNGGSGIIILRYAGATRGSGGNVITANGFTYHVFTTTGTYTA